MRLLFIFCVLISCFSCSVKPEALIYGKDACHHCKMTLMDTKFGAELVTKKGKVYKFDDMNCMLNFYNSRDEADFEFVQVVDFSNPEKLIEAKHAFYLKSGNIRSPMASGVAAFESKEKLDVSNKEWRGILMSWGELVTQFK